MGYQTIKLYNQICDYVHIETDRFGDDEYTEVDSEPTWKDSSLLLAKFNNDLTAGDSSLQGNIVGYEIRRQKGANSYSEFVGNVSKSGAGYMVDYTPPSKGNYTYYLYPNTDNNTQTLPVVAQEVRADWDYWSLFVVDDTPTRNLFYISKIFKFELNLSIGEMNNNASITVTKNFTRTPTVQYGMSNYYSSELSSLCGFISCNDTEYVQTPNMVEELKSLTSDTRRKFLKDNCGNIWEVEITSPITFTTDNNVTQDVKTVKLSWTEVGDAKGISIINNPDKELVDWLLTETGQVVSYVDYIWNDTYKWDNSFRWTENDDRLEVSNYNLGRNIT